MAGGDGLVQMNGVFRDKRTEFLKFWGDLEGMRKIFYNPKELWIPFREMEALNGSGD